MAATAMHTPSVMKNAIVVLRLVMRMGMGDSCQLLVVSGQLSVVTYQ